MGARGRARGRPNYAEVVRADGSVEEYAVVAALEVNEGDVIRTHTGQGGGYGDPLDRDPAAAAGDVRNDYASREAARSLHGVVLTPAGEVDADATAKARAELVNLAPRRLRGS